MRFFEGYRCGACGFEVEAGSPAGECPACAGPLLCVYDTGAIRRGLPGSARAPKRGGKGVWRFRRLLPDFAEEITLGEGCTPLIPAGRLGETIGMRRLYLKDESANPTGSFKARGMAVAVSRLRALGISTACVPSAGNAGLALAAYGAAALIRCRVFIPSDAPSGVAEECRLYGAEVVSVSGVISDASRALDASVGTDRGGVLSTFREPCRVEGKKTIAFELEDEIEPEWIVFPTGGGTGIVALWKAYRELEAIGALRRPMPRLAVVQAAGCAPLVRAFEEGTDKAKPWKNPATIASGIRVPSSRADMLILKALRESAGAAVSVEDGEIMAAVKEIAGTLGVFSSPEGAAAWAGLKRLVRTEAVSPSARIVIVNTAGGARYRFLLESS
ncbi:MAG: threonine synthase [Candidatus Krumholzibacteria bacterium]|nr:threonine synthase [Candidatus Krumholzibacteria bacterium]